jgi:hypothetical protein
MRWLTDWPVKQRKELEMIDKELFVRCECGSIDHQIIFSFWPDDEPEHNLISMEVHLANLGFFRRLKRAVRYALGQLSQYGDWDEVLIGPEKAKEIIEFLDEYLASYEKEGG